MAIVAVPPFVLCLSVGFRIVFISFPALACSCFSIVPNTPNIIMLIGLHFCCSHNLFCFVKHDNLIGGKLLLPLLNRQGCLLTKGNWLAITSSTFFNRVSAILPRAFFTTLLLLAIVGCLCCILGLLYMSSWRCRLGYLKPLVGFKLDEELEVGSPRLPNLQLPHHVLHGLLRPDLAKLDGRVVQRVNPVLSLTHLGLGFFDLCNTL